MGLPQYLQPFQPIRESTSPAFLTTAGNASVTYGLEASALNAEGSTNVRKWDYPTSRAIRIASIAGDDFYVTLGSSDISTAIGTGMLVLGGTAEILRVQPNQTSIAIASSTDVVANITLGYGA